MSALKQRLYDLSRKLEMAGKQMANGYNYDHITQLIDDPDLSQNIKDELSLFLKEAYEERKRQAEATYAKDSEKLANQHKEKVEELEKLIQYYSNT